MHVLTQSWKSGAMSPRRRALALTLTNVKTVSVDAAAASLPSGTATVETDGPTALTLTHLAPATRVRGAGGPVTAGRDGRVTITLRDGTTRIAWGGRHA